MPGHRVYIENRFNGPSRLVRVNSHHQRGDARVRISSEDLDEILDLERDLREQLEQQTRQTKLLKSELHTAQENLRQARSYHKDLVAENQGLRRSLEDVPAREARHDRKMRELGNQKARLEEDNDALRIQIRDLTRELSHKLGDAVETEVARLRGKYDKLEREYEDLQRRYKRMGDNLDNYAATNEALQRDLDAANRKLRRHGL